MIRISALAALLLVLLTGPTRAAEFTPKHSGQIPLGPVHDYAPPEGHKTNGLVILISDDDGWTPATAALADHLAGEGQAVVGLELPVYRAAIQKDTVDCVYVNADMEALARNVEETLPFGEYRPPVIMGLGHGAGIAYAVVSQVLPNTFAGGVGLGFDPSFDVGHKLCLPLAETPLGAPPRYGPVPDHETPWVFSPSTAFAGPDGGLKPFLDAMHQAHAIDKNGDWVAQADAALKMLPKVGKAEESIDGLPLVEIPPAGGQTSKHPLVVFYSGDGGWRDIDKKIGAYLAEQGYFVAGIDSLRYFWRKKDPAQMAGDLDRLIRHYRPQSDGNGVILVGYSFGADVLPFMVSRMAPDTRAEVKMVSLMGVSDRASFEIRLQGILGAANSDGPPTLPELLKLKGIPIQCIFGETETDSVCAQPELDAAVDRIELNGGHHFDGNYRHTADLIIAADKIRMSKLK